MPADKVQVEIIDQPEATEVKEKKEDDDVKDSWDADSTEDEQEEGTVLCMDYNITRIIHRLQHMTKDLNNCYF